MIVLAVLLAWSGASRGPFVFDDHEAVVNNPTLRDFWSLDWMAPPATAGETVSGRPVLNFTFALNHAIGGLNPRGYHLVNIGIHALAALLVFSVVRRTLLRGDNSSATGRASLRLAGSGRKPDLPPASQPSRTAIADTEFFIAVAVALLWAVHPLQTAAVTSIAQRAESLAGLWYLLALYGYIRAGEPGSSRARWSTVSVLACLLGVGTKETVVTLPLVAALWERTFAAGSWREVWQRSGRLLLLLATSWLPLAALVLAHDGRGASAGWASTITPWSYLLTQAAAIPHYLRLMLWPAGLVFDHGTPLVASLSAVWPQALALAGALAASVWGAWCGRPWGFLGLAFFVLLAPSSSVVPIVTQTMAEHRCYLALLPVVLAVGLVVRRLRSVVPSAGQIALIAAVALALGLATWHRNTVYASAITLWQDTATRRPDNPRAFNNLGQALAAAGNLEAAATAYTRALALAPDHAFAHGNLGAIRLQSGQLEPALHHLTRAVELDPTLGNARFNLADVLARQGRPREAMDHLRILLTQEPAAPDARLKLAALLTTANHLAEAEAVLREAETHVPGSAAIAFALGNLHVQRRNLPEALRCFTTAVERDPQHVEAHANLGNCQLMAGQFSAAIASYEAVLRLRPDHRQVGENLALARQMARQNPGR